jgi:hypothetical protein
MSAAPKLAKSGEESASEVVYVTPTTWKRLNSRRDRGVTFNEVIAGLLDDADEALADDLKKETGR